MIATLREFPGLPHRCQWVGEYNGVSWYNDSKGTNLGATQAAIRGIDGPIVLIAGGDGKGADFSPLADSVRGKCRAVILIGQDAPRLEAAIGAAAPVAHAASMREAVLYASERMLPGDSVLLSPACSSLDMFRNYQERGTVFMESVRERMK
jgi:UDP-N-acetylmuramoylalanine--D-glutamate ligase